MLSAIGALQRRHSCLASSIVRNLRWNWRFWIVRQSDKLAFRPLRRASFTTRERSALPFTRLKAESIRDPSAKRFVLSTSMARRMKAMTLW
jgi:hypothetical protein